VKNNNFKNFFISIIIFQLLKEEETGKNTYNLINLYNLNKIERLILQEKDKQIPKVNVKLNNKENKQIKEKREKYDLKKNIKIKNERCEKSAVLDKEKSKQILKKDIKLKEKMYMHDIKENSNTKGVKIKEDGKENIKLNEEKNNQSLKEKIELNEKISEHIPEANVELNSNKNKYSVIKNTELNNKKNKHNLKENIEATSQKNKQDIKLKEVMDKQFEKESTKLKEVKNNKDIKEDKVNKKTPKESIKLKNEKDSIKNVAYNGENNIVKKNKEVREKIFSKVPIVIASFEVEMIDSIFTKIDSTFIDIKEIKNNVFIESANLIKLNSNKAKLFIKGYIRNYIEYITLDNINKGSITTKNQGMISHKEFNKAININLLFFNNMKEGESFFVDFNNYIKDKKVLLGKIEKIDIKSGNIYKNVKGSIFEKEKYYLTLHQNLSIKVNIEILQRNLVIL